jgi:acyl-coenzyme A synthetase/AMP-(fatty) acid ligase
VDQFSEYALLERSRDESKKLHPDLALLMTTSGTTASRKVVRLTKNNIVSNAKSITDYLNIKMDDRAITTMPMSYSYGLSIINSHLYNGASIVVTDKTLLKREFWELWTKYRPTSFSGVPYLYEVLMKLDFEDRLLPELRYLTQAGGRLRQEFATKIVESCERKGVEMYFMYGQTEASPRMGYLPPEYAKKKGSIGLAIPSGKFWLEDDLGIVVNGAGVVGELIYQGPNVGMGYAESLEDLNNPDENNGVLRTGDLAKRDRDGFYYLIGRKTRFVKLFGNRVDLDDLEGLISSTGCECVCIGNEESVKIFLTDGDCEANVRTVLSKLGIHRKVAEIKKIKRIPRNEFGKIMYSKLM